MNAPKIGFKGGLEILVFFGLVFTAWKLYKLAANGVSTAIDTTANAVGGGLYDLTHTDPVAAATSTFQQAMADLRAHGSPSPGTQAYNDIVIKYGIAPAPITGSPATSVSAGSSSGS